MKNITENEINNLVRIANYITAFDGKYRATLRDYEDTLLKKNPIRAIIANDKAFIYKNLLLYGTLPFGCADYTMNIERLWSKAMVCNACGKQVIKRRAMPTGNIKPKYMFIGESPGVADGPKSMERAWGYGPSSILLRKSLLHSKILFQSWFTNILKCSLPENKKSSDEPFKKCIKFLELEIELLKPKRIFIMGKNAQNFIQKTSLYNIIKNNTSYIPHPSYYLRKGADYKEYSKNIMELI